MNKLAIEHICGYIPYGIKVQVNDIKTNESRIDEVECISNELITFKDSPDWYFNSDENDTEIKLILHRIKDMSKELKREMYITQDWNKYNVKKQAIELSKFFYSNHIDISQLIDAGLAIDKKLLK